MKKNKAYWKRQARKYRHQFEAVWKVFEQWTDDAASVGIDFQMQTRNTKNGTLMTGTKAVNVRAEEAEAEANRLVERNLHLQDAIRALTVHQNRKAVEEANLLNSLARATDALREIAKMEPKDAFAAACFLEAQTIAADTLETL